MKTFPVLLSLIFVGINSPAATIDQMTLKAFSNVGYSPSSFSLPSGADSYFLSDGTSWGSGAGIYYNIFATYQSTVVSDGFVYYHFSPLNFDGILFHNTDYDGSYHSAQGTLGWAGDVVLVAEVGSTQARFSGATTILDNTETWYGQPRFNYYSASVGQSVFFEMDFTISGATWQPETFNDPFNYSASGYVDFTNVVPEPNSFTLLAVAAALSLASVVSHKRLELF